MLNQDYYEILRAGGGSTQSARDCSEEWKEGYAYQKETLRAGYFSAQLLKASRQADPSKFEFKGYGVSQPAPPGSKLVQYHQINFAENMKDYFDMHSEARFKEAKEFCIATDISKKVYGRTFEDGHQVSTDGKLSMMLNETGHICGSVALSSGTCWDASAEALIEDLGNQLSPEQRDQVIIMLDNPAEAVLYRRLMNLLNKGSAGYFTVAEEMIEVVDEAEDYEAACDALRNAGNVIHFDTENVWDKNDKARSKQVACIAQLYAGTGRADSENKCYIFNFNRLGDEAPPSCFSDLFADPNVKIAAHNMPYDKRTLNARFDGMRYKNIVELKSLISPGVLKVAPNKKLGTLVSVLLEVELKGKDDFDHAHWDNDTFTDLQLQYAACDVVSMPELAAVESLDTAVFDLLVDIAESQSTLTSSDIGSAAAALGTAKEVGSVDNVNEIDADEQRAQDFDNSESVDKLADGTTVEAATAVTAAAAAAEAVVETDLTNLFVSCIRMIEEFAGDSDRRDALRLPAGLSKDQRRALHTLARDMHLKSYSIGDTLDMESSERQMVVEKLGTFTTATSLLGARAIGYVVQDVDGRRGIVDFFDPIKELWTVSYKSDSEQSDSIGARARARGAARVASSSNNAGPASESESDLVQVDLAGLNDALRRRWESDNTVDGDADAGGGSSSGSSAAGSAGSSSAAGSTPSFMQTSDTDTSFLDSFLEGVDDDWKTSIWKFFKYDLKHYLGICASMSAASKTSTMHKVFMTALADNFSRLRVHEMERVIADLLRRGYSMDEIRKLRRSYFRRRARVHRPDPKTLIKGFVDLMNVFASVDDPERQGKKFLVHNWKEILKKQVGYIQLGLLSWDEGRPAYVKAGVTTYGFQLYRSLLGTSALEGYGFHYSLSRAAFLYYCDLCVLVLDLYSYVLLFLPAHIMF